VGETIRAAALKGYVDLARSLGLDPLRLLDRVGIPRLALEEPEMHISAAAARDLWELCGRDHEDFGLRVSERRTVANMGPVTLILREQRTLRAALEAVIRHLAVHTQAVIVTVEEIDDLAIVRLTPKFETPGPARQMMETSVHQLLRALRVFTGPNWRPLSVSLTHSAPARLETHQRTLGPVVHFNADFYGVVMRRADLDARNEAADPEMARQIERYVGGLTRPADSHVSAQVRGLVPVLLPSGHCNIGAVARQLGLDPRTLQRQLARDETSFQEIVQDVRLGMAAQYVEESDRPLAEVAELMGFSALSAFSRWHRDQHGQSPSARRTAVKSGVRHAGQALP
jgi:AraC-like DNA-binding protein